MLWAFFERDGPESEAGGKLLRGLVQTPPDNKAVEEFIIRSSQKGRNANRQSKPVQKCST